MASKKIASTESSAFLLIGTIFLLSVGQQSISLAKQAGPSTKPATIKTFLSALDKNGLPVLDLKPQEIEITEKGRKLPIILMKSARWEPLRAAILVDVSGSERDSTGFNDADALSAFINDKLTTDDFVLVATFYDLTYLITDWSNSPRQIESAIRRALSEPRRGGSSVHDAIYAICNKKINGQPGSSFIVLISDMDDNESRHDHNETLEAVLQADAAIYVLWEKGRHGHNDNVETRRAWRNAETFTQETGGSVVEVTHPEDFRKGLQEINHAIAGRYILEIENSTDPPRPGIHKINVKCSREGVRLLAPTAYFVAGK